MNKNSFKRENLRIARIAYFSEEMNGVDLEKSNAYVIIGTSSDKNEGYVNVFDQDGTLPVFDRSKCQTNFTKDWVEYGTKVFQVGGEIATGPCYIIEKAFKPEELPRRIVTLKTLKRLIYGSNHFFPDRLILMREESLPTKLKYVSTIHRDRKCYKDLTAYLIKHEKERNAHVKKK